MKNNHFLNDEAFDALMQQRHITPPHADLTSRIVNAALRIQPFQSISIHQWLRELLADVMLPRPAYTFSSILVVGFLVGFVFAPILAKESPADPQTILTDEGDLP